MDTLIKHTMFLIKQNVILVNGCNEWFTVASKNNENSAIELLNLYRTNNPNTELGIVKETSEEMSY